MTPMPGSVQTLAGPLNVFPALPLRGLRDAAEPAVIATDYDTGHTQRRAEITIAPRRFRLTMVLSATQASTLRAFLAANDAFYWYNPKEGPRDGTGAALLGRYTVVREGAVTETAEGPNKVAVELTLKEIA